MRAGPATAALTASTARTTAGVRPMAGYRPSTACRGWSTPPMGCRCFSTPESAAAPTSSRRWRWVRRPSAWRGPTRSRRPSAGGGGRDAFGLAIGGGEGGVHVLPSLLPEADLIMAVDGYPTLKDLTPDALR